MLSLLAFLAFFQFFIQGCLLLHRADDHVPFVFHGLFMRGQELFYLISVFVGCFAGALQTVLEHEVHQSGVAVEDRFQQDTTLHTVHAHLPRQLLNGNIVHNLGFEQLLRLQRLTRFGFIYQSHDFFKPFHQQNGVLPA